MTPDTTEWPRQYLHVRDCRTGEEWVKPLTSRALMDLATQARRWVKEWSGGAAHLAGKVMSRVEGEFYAQLVLNGDDPHSGRCWEGGGFFIEIPQYYPGLRVTYATIHR